MPEIKSDDFVRWLDDDGPIAIIIRQPLAPDDDDEKIIFPPTYPLTMFKGRVQSFNHGDYRVSIELPPDSRNTKDDNRENQKSGYQIDRFPDGTNICEIDSIQSQSNRIEPKFKKIKDGKLVPQIEIKVGTEKVNLLDAGHRAADAVVRLSSLADEFHKAFLDVKAHNQFKLATLAPTSLVFGVWDSRSTYEKRQRLIKAHIRATNVRERTRSAQFTPAADYVAAGAVDEELDAGEGENNPLSSQGMKHALATQTVGGVMLTKDSKLVRTVNVNVAAIRELRGGNNEQTKALQEYILGLALLAAAMEPDLNLREGCNLRCDGSPSTKMVHRNKAGEPIMILPKQMEDFAEVAAKAFFKLAGIDFEKKDNREATFETGVAEEFLAMTKEDRDKVSRLGPITAATIKRFNEQGKDPFKLIKTQLDEAKKAIGKSPGKKQPRVKNLEALKPVSEVLKSMADNASLSDSAKALAGELSKLAQDHEDSHSALKEIEKKIKDFKQTQKTDGAKVDAPSAEDGITPE